MFLVRIGQEGDHIQEAEEGEEEQSQEGARNQESQGRCCQEINS